MAFIFAENILHLIWNIVTEEKKKEEVKPVHERSKQSNSKKSKCLGQVNMSYHHWEYLIHSLRHPLLQIPPPLPCLSVRWISNVRIAILRQQYLFMCFMHLFTVRHMSRYCLKFSDSILPSIQTDRSIFSNDKPFYVMARLFLWHWVTILRIERVGFRGWLGLSKLYRGTFNCISSYISRNVGR